MVLLWELGMGGMMGQIKIIANAITKDEQLDIARLLIKAGYTVSLKKGKVVDGKGSSFIIFEKQED